MGIGGGDVDRGIPEDDGGERSAGIARISRELELGTVHDVPPNMAARPFGPLDFRRSYAGIGDPSTDANTRRMKLVN